MAKSLPNQPETDAGSFPKSAPALMLAAAAVSEELGGAITFPGHLSDPDPETGKRRKKPWAKWRTLTRPRTEPHDRALWERPITYKDDRNRYTVNAMAVRCDGLLVIDIDNPELADRLVHDHGLGTRMARTPSGGMHFYFYDDPEASLPCRLTSEGDYDLKRGSGALVFAPPTPGYELVFGGDPADYADAAPLLADLAAIAPAAPRPAAGAAELDGGECPDAGWPADWLDDALLWLPAAEMSYDEWLAAGASIHHASGGSIEGLKVWDDWSRLDRNRYDADEMPAKWRSLGRYTGRPRGLGSIWHEASQAGWTPPKRQKPDGADVTEQRRARQRRNTKARSSAIDRVHDDSRVIYLERRCWEHLPDRGWLHVPDEIMRARMVVEIAKDLGIIEQGVTPRLTSDALQSFRDTCQPLGAAEIGRLDSNEAAELKTGRPVAGTPWLDVMLRVTDAGQVQVMRRDKEIWCPRPPIPVEWDDGSYVTPSATLEWLRRATTAIDADTNAPDAHRRADWLMAGLGQVLAERPEDHTVWAPIGEGRRGKGTFLRLLEELVGGATHDISTPKDLADRFAMSHLETARVLVLPDAPECDLRDADTRTGISRIKNISGGDKVPCEIKNGPRKSVRLRVIVWVASNYTPAWASSAADFESWVGRLRVSDWCGPRPKRKIVNYEKQLIARDGLVNIARYAIDCYRRLLRGELTEPPEWAALRDQMLRDGIDPMERWATECLARSSTTFTPTAELLNAYRRWAEHRDIPTSDDYGKSIVTSDGLTAAIKRKYVTLAPQRRRKGGIKQRGWMVTIVPPDEDDPGEGGPRGPRPIDQQGEPTLWRTSEAQPMQPGPPGPRNVAPPPGAHGGPF